MQIVGEKSIGSIETKPVGTGPFKFAKLVPGDHIRVEKNDTYWVAGTPLLDQLVVQERARCAVPACRPAGRLGADGRLDRGKDVMQAQAFRRHR